MPCTGDEDWIGVVVSGHLQGIYSEAYDDHWHGKYEKDEFGEVLVEQVWDDSVKSLLIRHGLYNAAEHDQLLKQHRTNIHGMLSQLNQLALPSDHLTSKVSYLEHLQDDLVHIEPKWVPKMNAEYDPSRVYIPRCQRASYVPVAYRGTVVVQATALAKTLAQPRKVAVHAGKLTFSASNHARLTLINVTHQGTRATVRIH